MPFFVNIISIYLFMANLGPNNLYISSILIHFGPLQILFYAACEDEVSWLCCMSTKLSHWWGWPASHYCRLGQTNDCVKQEIFICIRSFKPLYLAEPLTSWLTSISLCIMASLHASFISIGRWLCVQAPMINLTKAVW